MPFKHDDKSPGDLIRSAEWNEIGREVQRLGTDKVDRAGDDTVAGPLTVRGDLTVGTPNAGAAVRVLRRQEDASAAEHGALVLGTGNPSAATLRLGYGSGYSWLQGSGLPALALNPRGGNVGVGTPAPASRLSVAGGATVGAGYAGTAAPVNSLIVEGRMGVGVANPQASLEVSGDVVMGGPAGQRFVMHTRRNGSGDFLQLTVDNESGGWVWDRGVTLRRETGNVGIGTTNPGARLHVAGGDLRLDAAREVVFADGGQIRSLDNSHRILFRRAENKLELREFGDIVFSPGATAGNETAKAVLTSGGRLGIGVEAPQRVIHTEGGEIHSGGGGGGFSFSNRQSAYVENGGNGDRWVLYAHERSARLWSAGDKLTVGADGTVTASAFRFGRGSVIKGDQGGSIELGGDNTIAGGGTPYIDFHFGSLVQDYNARIINDANGHLSISAAQFNVRDCFGVSLACADFNIGHPGRRGSPGRALVDNTSQLILNYGNDWTGGVRYYGTLSQVSTREVKEDIAELGANEAAEILSGLVPVRFRLIADEEKVPQLGFIAEEVPDAIATPDRGAIVNAHVVAVLTRMVKEQQRRLDDLTRRLEQVPTHA